MLPLSKNPTKFSRMCDKLGIVLCQIIIIVIKMIIFITFVVTILMINFKKSI